MSFCSTFLTIALLFVLGAGISILAQQPVSAAATPSPTPVPTPAVSAKDALKSPTAEQLAETAIFLYGLGGGRATLNQIRKTAVERGRITIANADGKMERANYQRFMTRGESFEKDKIRLDQEFPTARYSLVYSDEKTFGIFDNSVFTPREDASRAFQNQIAHSVETLLRYKENGSKLEVVGKEKKAGVDLHVLDVTDKQNRKTRFYLSAKDFRVKMLEYEDSGVKYLRKFYDYNVAQGTLFPYRSVLYLGDKIIEETDIGTVTFGQRIEDNMYAAN